MQEGLKKIDRYVAGFAAWLQLMNYARSSHRIGPRRIREFLNWLKKEKITALENVTSTHIYQFFEYLKKRKNKRTGAVLSLATLRNYQTTLNRFARYLRLSEDIQLDIRIQLKGNETKAVKVLSKMMIEKLYDTTADDLLGIRDRAMLGVYYGCGLRRNEGIELEVKDLLFERNLLFVRKGKGGKERYVPMVGKVKNDLLNYVENGRPPLLKPRSGNQLFISLYGKPLQANSMYERFKQLQKRAGTYPKTGLHSLRHSIATHLLNSGMSLKDIGKFLGHRSLESTQIYTHLKDERLICEAVKYDSASRERTAKAGGQAKTLL